LLSKIIFGELSIVLRIGCCFWVAQGFSPTIKKIKTRRLQPLRGCIFKIQVESTSAAKANHPAVSEIPAMKRLRHPKSFAEK
jgi:hypothetical protein